MPTRLRPIDLTVLVDKTGTDTSQVPSVGAAVAFYKQGATVSSVGPVTIATGTAVSVYDTGRLAVGDTVQKGASAAATATVASIVSRTSITLTIATGSMSLSRSDRLVVTGPSRPTIYSESSGVLVHAASPTPLTVAGGSLDAFSTEVALDAVISGGTPSVTAQGRYDIPAGYFEPRPWADVRDYGYNETGLRAAIDALPSGGGTVYIAAGEIELASALTITKAGVRLLGDTSAKSRLIASAVNPAHHLVVIEALAVTLEHLEFDARGTTSAAYDVVRIVRNATNVNSVHIVNCGILNGRRYGLYVAGAFDTQIRDSAISGHVDNGVRCENNAYTTTHIYFDNVAIGANDILAADKPAVYLNTTAGARFLNCRFEANRGGATTANGIDALSCEYLHVEACHFEIINSGPYVPTARPSTYCRINSTRTPVFLNNGFYGGTDSTLRPTYAVTFGNSYGAVVIGGKMNTLNTNGVSADKWCTIIGVEVSGAATTHNLAEGSVAIHEGLIIVPKYTTATRVAAAAALDGALYFDTTTGKLNVCTGGAWVVVGTQV